MVSRARLAIGIAAAGLALAPTGRASAEDSPAEKAYTLALMCTVVAAYFKDDAASLKAMGAADKIGAQLGYDRPRRSTDLSNMARTLGTERSGDAGSWERHRAVCRKIGMAT